MKSVRPPSKKKLKTGRKPYVKVEVLLVLDFVEVSLQAGYTLKAVWRELRSTKRIESSYSAFYKVYKQLTTNHEKMALVSPSVLTPEHIDKHVSNDSILESKAAMEEAIEILGMR